MDTAILKLLSRLGNSLTLTKKTTGTYTPGSGISGATSTPLPATGKIIEYDDKFKDGSLIQASDRKAIIAASGLAVSPQINDQIIEDAVTYNIVRVQKIKRASIVVAYVCQVRA